MAEKKKAGILLAEAALRRRYKDSNLASIIAFSEDDTLVLPSTNLALNFQMGGGIKYGSILELFGEESTGKTLLAMEFAKACIQLGGMVLWDDAEASWTNYWARKNGLDLDRVELLKDENIVEIVSDWIADFCIFYRSKLTNNEPILLVGDSIASWETAESMEEADTDSKDAFSKRSKKIYQMLRKRRKIFAKYGICVIFINQLRQKVGATKWEDPDTTPGGKAMKFFADYRLGLYRGKKVVNKDDKKVGQHVYIRTKKNKVAPPRDTVKAKVIFRKTNGVLGYDKYSGLIEVLEESKTIQVKRGPCYYFNGKMIAKGEVNMMKKIANDDQLRAELIAASPINTLSKTRKKIEEVDRNLYPVKLKIKKDAKESKDNEAEE